MRVRPAPDFTPEGYRALLDAFLARGYVAGSFSDARADAAHVILRHDLDMSLEAALPIAKIEQELGVKATYFVLLRTEMYNPWSAGARSVLERITALGHEIGLHLDAAYYGDDLARVEVGAEQECRALEDLTGNAVKMISLHRPLAALQGRDRPIAGRRHSYEPAFFTEMGYCSDSRGGWHHGHPLDHEAVRQARALQLLTHPIWWTANEDEGVVARLNRFAAERHALLKRELAAHCEPYRQVNPHDGKNGE